MGSTPRSPRTSTLLARKIAERNMTVEEFAAYAETFAREHDEPGTLSHRHLQRLALTDGATPNLRPATRRLLEALFGLPVSELLAPDPRGAPAAYEDDLTHRLDAARRVDAGVVRLFSEQLDGIRRMDRQFGAEHLLDTLRGLIGHAESVLDYSTAGPTARALASVLSQAHTLAGWQSLDGLAPRSAWDHYQAAITAARTAESSALYAHALAEQSVVLMDLERHAEAVELAAHALDVGARKSPLLRCWLTAMHSEALAASGNGVASLDVFERTAPRAEDAEGPFLILDGGHLERWRGHVLAVAGHPEAATALRGAMAQHDGVYRRAGAALHLDLATALLREGDREGAAREVAIAAAEASASRSLRLQSRSRRLLAG